MANQIISNKLKEARILAGFTQKDVYQWLGIGQSTFSAWETGQGEPSLEVFLRLCKKYEIADIAAFFSPEQGSIGAKPQLDPLFIRKMLSLSERGQAAVRNCLDFEYTHRASSTATLRKMRRIPLYTQAATAGLGNYLDDTHQELLQLEAPEGADFALKISGDSMEPLIHHGETVFVQKREMLESGEIGIFSYNDESFCKVFDNRHGSVRLISLNPAYQPITLHSSDRLLIHGKVLL